MTSTEDAVWEIKGKPVLCRALVPDTELFDGKLCGNIKYLIVLKAAKLASCVLSILFGEPGGFIRYPFCSVLNVVSQEFWIHACSKLEGKKIKFI